MTIAVTLLTGSVLGFASLPIDPSPPPPPSAPPPLSIVCDGSISLAEAEERACTVVKGTLYAGSSTTGNVDLPDLEKVVGSINVRFRATLPHGEETTATACHIHVRCKATKRSPRYRRRTC